MELTTVYVELDVPSRPGAGGCPRVPLPPGRRWYWATLGAGWVGTAVLAGIVLWLLQRHDGNGLIQSREADVPTGTCSWATCLSKASPGDVPEYHCSLNCFQLQLRERLCEPKSHRAAGAVGCWLCPVGWQPFATKCYWVSAKIKSWEMAAADCKDRQAQLVVLESAEEKDFTGTMSGNASRAWMGLSTIRTQGKEWTWQDGSPLQEALLQVMGERRANACAAIWKGQLHSHTCSASLHWICQKEATKI